MGQAVTYDDIPAGFQLGGTAAYNDVPAGFAVGGSGKSSPDLLHAFTQGAATPFAPIVSNTLDTLHNVATQTGQAVSEPYNEKNVPGWLEPIDIGIKTLGKVGNALGSVYGAVTSPLAGALSASVEPAVQPIAHAVKQDLVPTDPRFRDITPGQAHQLALQTGSDLANAVMMGKAGSQGEAALRARAGLPPAPKPYDPMQPVWEALAAKTAAAKSAPRASFWQSQSSDPMAPPPPETFSPDALFEKAGKYYDAADAQKAVIGAPKIQTLAGDIKTSLDNNNFDADFHPETAKWLTKFQNSAVDENGNPVNLTWQKVNGFRKLLNGVINDSMKKGGTEDGYQAMVARDALDSGLNGLQPSDLSGGNPAAIDLTRQGNALWSAANKAQAVQNILDNADMTDNPTTAIKTGFRTLVKSIQKNTAGWQPDEIAAINHAARTGIATDALRLAGSRLGPLISGGVGLATGGPIGGAATAAADYALSGAARGLAGRLQANRGNAVIDALSARPAVQAAMQGEAVAPPVAASPPSSPPILALPAPETPMITDAQGNARPMTPAERDAAIVARQNEQAMGITPDVRAAQQARAISGAMPLRTQSGIGQWAASQGMIPFTEANAANAAAYIPQTPENPGAAIRAKTNPIFAQIEAQVATEKAAQIEQMFRSNTEKPEQLVANAAQKFKDAGLPIGEVGKALMQFLNNQQGSVPLPRFLALRDAISQWQQGQQIPAIPNAAIQQMQKRLKSKPPSEVADSAAMPGPPPQSPLLDRIAQAESGGNPDARNPNSTASGPLQFTNGTWAQMVAKYGKQTGITFKDKDNPQAQAVMGELLARDNAKVLTKDLGRAPTDGEIYMAHVFGADGAAKLIRAQGTGRDAITLFPRSVTAENSSLFWSKGKPRTVEQLYNILSEKVSA